MEYLIVALIIIAALLGIAVAASAIQKLRRDPMVVESMHGVGVTDRQMPVLAGLELLGVLGLVVGVWIPPIGVAAAAALTLYFLGAIIANLRARTGAKGVVAPLVLTLLAAAVTALELAR